VTSESDSFDPLAATPTSVAHETAWLVGQALRLMHSPAGDAGEQEYAQVVRLLRRDVAAATSHIAGRLRSASKEPTLRWSLLYVVAHLEDPGCITLLRAQALRKLPRIVRRKGICEQQAEEEELVAVMAIEGLGRLAQTGDRDAVEALIEVVSTTDRRSLRQPAVSALLAAQPKLHKPLQELLPESEKYLLALREATRKDLTVEVGENDTRGLMQRRQVYPKVALPHQVAPIAPGQIRPPQ
jgi:HEAT repeat protein